MQKTNEIDIVKLVKKVLAEKKLLGYFVLVFAVIGIIYAINQQKRYTSVVVMAPEITGMGLSASLSDLADMVGMNLGGKNGSVDAIYPDIYPEVLASTEFVTGLFEIPVKQKGDETPKYYYDHIKQDTKVPFWSYPQIWLHNYIDRLTENGTAGANGGVNPKNLTKEQNDIYHTITTNVGCQIDKNTSIITISVEDVDPYVATTIADTIQQRLQNYIILYRTHKARIDLEYAQKLNDEAEQDYIKARKEYAAFSDSHTGSVLMAYQTKQTELENIMDLKYTTYRQTALQVQQAAAKVQERTPAFTAIQEACVPLKSSSTPRSIMVLGFMVLGCLADALWVLYLRQFVETLRKKK